MKIRTRLTLVFSLIQLAGALTVGLSLSLFTRNVISGLVEKESREMTASIGEAVSLINEGLDDRGSVSFMKVRQYILNRSIGETGFYFVLDGKGTYLIHKKETVEGENWAGQEEFIDYILAHRQGSLEERFIRYVSPKTGEWKQVYFVNLPGLDWTICSSAWEHEMYAPVKQINLILLIVLFITSLAIIIIGMRESALLSAVFGRITHALETVSSGDFTVSIKEDNYARETRRTAECLNKSVSGIMDDMIGSVKFTAVKSSDIGRRLMNDIDHSVNEIKQVDDTLHQLEGGLVSLEEMAERTAGSAESLKGTAGVLESQAYNLATAAEESSAAIEEITATMNSVRQVSLKQSQSGKDLLNELQTYRDALEELIHTVRNIESRINDISALNAIINDVAERTHLLAMNAAIEAARAGERGKGFAVVSTEIGELADSTGTNALRVGNTIGEISQYMKLTSDAGNTLQGNFTKLEERAREFIQAFARITDGTKELELGAREVADSSRTVHEGSRELAESVALSREAADEVDRLMKGTRGFVRESQAAFEEMNRRTSQVVASQEEIIVLTSWNNRNTAELARKTGEFITSRDQKRCQLTYALGTHQEWLAKLELLSGEKWQDHITGMEDRNSKSCPFGQWLDENKERLSPFEGYGDLVKVHDEFHVHSHLIMKEVAEKKQHADEEDINVLRRLSRKLVNLLNKADEELE